MTVLDVFSLIVLLVLGVTAIAIWLFLGMYPGKIARERNHPQAEAIAVCGWWGVITMGLLLPVAWIWAYMNPVLKPEQHDKTKDNDNQASQGEKP